MTATNISTELKKVFSKKNDTPEDARKRILRAGICVAVTALATVCLYKSQQLHAGTTIYNLCIAGYLLGIPAMLIATSSPVGIFKAWVAAFRFGMRVTPFHLLDVMVGATLCYLVFYSTAMFPVVIGFYGFIDSIKSLIDIEDIKETKDTKDTYAEPAAC